jgi:hypothetical protein
MSEIRNGHHGGRVTKRQPTKTSKQAKQIGIAFAVATLLCCGGVGINAIANDDSTPQATATTPGPRFVNPAAGLPTPTFAPVTETPDTPTATETTDEATAEPEPTRTTVTPKPKPKPKPKPTTKKPKPKPSPTEDEPEEVYYKNCTAVRAAGADPIRRGDPGYARHLDRDGDGIGCE